MTSADIVQPGGASPASQTYGTSMNGGRQPANLGDILERVLDKGLVIAGDIQVNLLDIELLTIKLRLVIASLDTARQVGIDWWEHDPWLSGRAQAREVEARGDSSDDRNRQLSDENRRLRDRIAALEAGERDD